MITIEGGSYQAIQYVAEHMRADDRREIEATSIKLDPAEMAQRIMANAAMVFVARHDGVPVSCWGMMQMWPGVGYAFCFGTDDWGSVLLPMTKHVGRFMVGHLLDNGFHRVETRGLADRKDVGRWLEIFGAKQEAVLRGSGARGEDFILYRWLSSEHRQTKTKHAAGDHNSPGGSRRHRADHNARDDAAAREPDLSRTVSLQSAGDSQMARARDRRRRLPAHRRRA